MQNVLFLRRVLRYIVHVSQRKGREDMQEEGIVKRTHIRANAVVIELIDEKSGQSFRRELPLAFEENANGIILRGENLKGEQTSIVFLSESAQERLRELRGEGAERPRCKDHETTK